MRDAEAAARAEELQKQKDATENGENQEKQYKPSPSISLADASVDAAMGTNTNPKKSQYEELGFPNTDTQKYAHWMDPSDATMNPNLLSDDAENRPGMDDDEAIAEHPDLERPIRVVSGTYRISPQELNVVFLFFGVRTRRKWKDTDGQECKVFFWPLRVFGL